MACESKWACTCMVPGPCNLDLNLATISLSAFSF